MLLTSLHSSSQIVTSNVYNFETENGRTYHGYRAGSTLSFHSLRVLKLTFQLQHTIFQMMKQSWID